MGNLKKLLEWGEHADFLLSLSARILLALGGGALVTGIVHTFANVNGWWLASVLLSSSSLLFLLLYRARLHRQSSNTTKTESERGEGIIVEFIRSHFIPSHWATGLVSELFRATNQEEPVLDFSLLYEVFLVNRGEDVTVKSVRAEARPKGEEDQDWKALGPQRDLGDFELRIERDDIPNRTARILKAERRPLDSLLAKIENATLHRGIGYRGWLCFPIKATEQQAKDGVETRLWITDALDHVHGAVKRQSEIEPSEGELTHSVRQFSQT
jgi:hypothetical protein